MEYVYLLATVHLSVHRRIYACMHTRTPRIYTSTYSSPNRELESESLRVQCVWRHRYAVKVDFHEFEYAHTDKYTDKHRHTQTHTCIHHHTHAPTDKHMNAERQAYA